MLGWRGFRDTASLAKDQGTMPMKSVVTSA
jgi:hypothetical protein